MEEKILSGNEIENKIEDKIEDGKKNKSKSIFWKVLRVYVVLWIIATVVLCVVIYKKASDYQKHYEAAASMIDPDKIANESLFHFDKEHFIETAGEGFVSFNEFENQDNIAKYLEELIPSGVLSCKRSDSYSDSKPAYNVYSDNELIGNIYLKKKAEADDYGFHDYEFSEAVNLVVPLPLKSCTINCFSDTSVILNGNEADIAAAANTEGSGVSLIEHNELNSYVEREAADYSNILIGKDTYMLTNLVEIPTVEVLSDGQYFEADVEEDVYSFNSLYDSEFAAAIDERLRNGFINASEAYIRNMNRHGSFDSVAMYLEAGSKAYQSIYSAQSGLSWSGIPTAFEIKSSEVKDVIKYGDYFAVVTTSHKTYRVLDGKEYDEEVAIEWLYACSDGKWRIRSFNIL